MAKTVFVTLSLLLTISIFVQHGCTEPGEKRAVYVLVDATGTYSEQFDKVQGVVRNLLSVLLPGEFLALARIDSESFDEKDIVARMNFDLRPSMANAQKRAFLESVEKFGNSINASKYTDITGGILQAIEYLNETQAKQRYIVILSDLKEDIKKDQVRNFPFSFNGIHVLAINVSKHKGDNGKPDDYLQRVDDWARRVEQGGGDWKLVDDINGLDGSEE